MCEIIDLNDLRIIDAICQKAIKSNWLFADLCERLRKYEPMCPAAVQVSYAKYYLDKKDYLLADQFISEAFEIWDKCLDLTCCLFDNVTWGKMYGLAGEIYYYAGKKEDSLSLFKKCFLAYSKIKSIETDEFLLSFRRYNEYSLSDLINNEITLCSPKVMNDPYDSLLFHWGKYLMELKDKDYLECYCRAFESYRIRSFSRLTCKGGCHNTVEDSTMWSHYAGNHEGYCIKYHLPNSITTINEADKTVRLKEIKYEESCDIRLDKIDSDIALLVKSKFWEYENEVRLVAYLPNEKEPYVRLPLSGKYIDSIYFGYRCSEQNIKTIRGILERYPKIKYYKMKSNYSDVFRLIPEELT